MTMMSPHTGHVATINGFISTCTWSITMKLANTVDHDALTLLWKWQWRHRSSVTWQTYTVLSPLLKELLLPNLGKYYASKFWPYPAERSGVTIYRLRDKHLWLYLHFCHVYSNQTLKNVTLHMTITPSPRDHVLNIYRLSPLL